ncbi:MAG: 3-oxoacyl-[acyl-carrier-protein] synthase 2 [Isosphaeraceae bacterium]|jgi:3-oxoacyl-[acyl-carrier-protein] synthase II|nr:MAG: 3-oxoacyl-[acyl-carrier-protein] synthase 2 [Isosphaeraceae bacterium]
MADTDRRVVITGVGVLTPLGIGGAALVSGLLEGRTGVGPLRAFDVDGVPCRGGAEVPGFDLRTLALPKHRKTLTKSLKYMARDIQLAVAGAELAMSDAGLAEGGVDPTRIGLDLGAGLISSDLDELAPAVQVAMREGGVFDFGAYGREGIATIPPIWLLKYLPNMLACHISIIWDCQGPSNSITEAESASSVALGEARRILERGRADVMISGGADSKIHPLSLVRMALFDQGSRWEGDPAEACRPFDRRRTGWVPGEGAGIVILERAEHAERRGARIYGEVIGFGSGCDAVPGGGMDPEGRGIEVAVRAALRDAGLEPGQVGHVNAHGAATVASDQAEARAYARIFGPRGVPVTGLKGALGNTASGSGAIELIGSLLCLARGQIPPTRNCTDPDPALELDVVTGSPRATDNPIFVKTTWTRHGQAAALVVRAHREASGS